jgi:hypothetical protein
VSNDQQMSPAAAAVMAAAFFVAGGAILALALGFVPVDPATLEAPRWVIASAGLMFLAGGIVPLNLVFGFPDWFNRLSGLVAGTGLAAVFNWIAFFPGVRHFTGTTSILGLRLVTASDSELTGRILFGVMALLVDAIVLLGLWRLLRRGACAPPLP